LRVLRAYPTIARHRGGRSLRLFRRRSTCRRRQNVSKRAGARLDQRHASVGQSPVRATGPERAALRSSGVVFTRRRSRGATPQLLKPPGVTLLTRQVLDDMDATTLRDAPRYVAGVTVR
jgi:hypothetical protein